MLGRKVLSKRYDYTDRMARELWKFNYLWGNVFASFFIYIWIYILVLRNLGFGFTMSFPDNTLSNVLYLVFAAPMQIILISLIPSYLISSMKLSGKERYYGYIFVRNTHQALVDTDILRLGKWYLSFYFYYFIFLAISLLGNGVSILGNITQEEIDILSKWTLSTRLLPIVFGLVLGTIIGNFWCYTKNKSDITNYLKSDRARDLEDLDNPPEIRMIKSPESTLVSIMRTLKWNENRWHSYYDDLRGLLGKRGIVLTDGELKSMEKRGIIKIRSIGNYTDIKLIDEEERKSLMDAKRTVIRILREMGDAGQEFQLVSQVSKRFERYSIDLKKHAIQKFTHFLDLMEEEGLLTMEYRGRTHFVKLLVNRNTTYHKF